MVSQSHLLLSIAYGAIGGLVAGLAITPLIMLAGVLAGLSENAILFALGMVLGVEPDNAIMTGIFIHVLISILIGIIFGILTFKIKKLRIDSIKKGVIAGIITGVIVFAALFIPLSTIVIPSVIVGIIREMNIGITNQQAIVNIQQSLPMIMGAGAIGYIIYGLTLGVVVAILQRIKGTTREEPKTKDGNHNTDS